MFGLWLDLMILEVFSNLNNSMILLTKSFSHSTPQQDREWGENNMEKKQTLMGQDKGSLIKQK